MTRALQRAIVAVGVAGFSAALLVGLGDDLMSVAAEAALSGGGASGSGGSSSDDAPVEELAASDAVGTNAGTAQTVVADVAVVGEGVVNAEVGGLPSVEQVAATPVALVVPSPPATAPTTTTTTTAPPPAPAPDPGSVEAVISEIFGPHARSAIGVARCESGLNPSAVSRGGGNWGLFQINRVHRSRVESMGYRWEDILDARVNTTVAYAIFSEQGWGPWGCRHAAY